MTKPLRDAPRCTESLFADWHRYQCENRAKYDPDANGNPTKCGIHSEAAKAKRAAKSKAKYDAESAKWARKQALHDLSTEAQQIVRQIAEGHNDPRSLCADWVARHDELTKPQEVR